MRPKTSIFIIIIGSCVCVSWWKLEDGALDVGLGVMARETTGGWPLLTDEAEEDGDSKSTNERGPSLVGSLSS